MALPALWDGTIVPILVPADLLGDVGTET